MLNRLTKKFILKEDLKVDAGASMQALYDIVSSIRVTNKRDTGRLQLAKEHIRSIKRQMRSLNERVNALEEELKVINQQDLDKKIRQEALGPFNFGSGELS